VAVKNTRGNEKGCNVYKILPKQENN